MVDLIFSVAHKYLLERQNYVFPSNLPFVNSNVALYVLTACEHETKMIYQVIQVWSKIAANTNVFLRFLPKTQLILRTRSGGIQCLFTVNTRGFS